MICGKRKERGAVGEPIDRDTWPHRIILTSLAGHQCLVTNTIRDPSNVRLFLVKQYVELIKKDLSNYGLFMSITPIYYMLNLIIFYDFITY